MDHVSVTERKTDERKPPWLKRRIACGSRQGCTQRVLRENMLHTVCREAKCPNRSECYTRGTATFMIMGRTCTRDCLFCAVEHGEPRGLEEGEPGLVAEAAAEMGLEHVVVTSVTRDDLEDGGASHFAATVKAVREMLPWSTVEVLIPDFKGDEDALEMVLYAGPDVINHNVETVPRLYPEVRPQADYARSLCIIGRVAESGFTAKSGLMVGLGEEVYEVLELLEDLRDAGCELVTVGQYLRPAQRNVPVYRFWDPAEFSWLENEARELGFSGVASGPLVRSSYHAEMMWEDLLVRGTAN